MYTFMRKFTYPIVITVLAIIMQCCAEDPKPSSRKAVLEGYIRSGENPTVIFSSSIVPGISGNVSDMLVNWGKVTISDGDNTVVLTGRADASYTPPFIYYTFDMAGIPGKTYTVTADFKDLKARASARMPLEVGIDSITLSKTENDTLRAATVHFTSPDETPSYFYLSMKKNERGARMLPCMMGTIKTDRTETHYSIPLLRPRIKTDSTQYISQLIVGEEWIVSLNRIEKPAYDFWKAYDDMVMFANSPFISTSESLPTNISGGYGIWSVEASTQMPLTVR